MYNPLRTLPDPLWKKFGPEEPENDRVLDCKELLYEAIDELQNVTRQWYAMNDQAIDQCIQTAVRNCCEVSKRLEGQRR